MKSAILSDIHSNPTALEAVLRDAKEQGCEKYICLGDIVGYGYDPVSCLEKIRSLNIPCVKGNHDCGLTGELRLGWFSDTAANAIKRQIPEVSQDLKEWITKNPYRIVEELDAWRCAFAHGSYYNASEFNYIQDLLDASRNMFFMAHDNVDVLFVGHTHYAEAYAEKKSDNGRMENFMFDTLDAPDLTLNLNNYDRTVINVGSVGYPRNQNESWYVIFDSDEGLVHFRSLEFDYDDYIENFEKKNIPKPMWLQRKIETHKNLGVWE